MELDEPVRENGSFSGLMDRNACFTHLHPKQSQERVRRDNSVICYIWAESFQALRLKCGKWDREGEGEVALFGSTMKEKWDRMESICMDWGDGWHKAILPKR